MISDQSKNNAMKMILASHGSLAEGLLSAVRMIAGDEGNIEAFGLDTYETPAAIVQIVADRIAARPPGEHLVILCDIKGGSVYNELLPLCAADDVSLISGMNLGLALGLALASPHDPVRETQQNAIDMAKQYIEYYDKDVLAELKKQEEEDELW